MTALSDYFSQRIEEDLRAERPPAERLQPSLELMEAVDLAIELEELRNCGAVFEVDELSVTEWTAIRALHRGRGEAEERWRRSQQQQPGSG